MRETKEGVGLCIADTAGTLGQTSSMIDNNLHPGSARGPKEVNTSSLKGRNLVSMTILAPGCSLTIMGNCLHFGG